MNDLKNDLKNHPDELVGAAVPAPNSAAAGVSAASKIYGSGESEVRALDNVNVGFEKGRFTAIMGPSGSGKSTLMHCAAGLDRLTSGSNAPLPTRQTSRSETRSASPPMPRRSRRE